MFISKWLHIHCLRRLLSCSFCPYRSGDRDGLPDLVIVVPLLGKSGLTLFFGVAIMFALIIVGWLCSYILPSLVHASHRVRGT
jgi:hypothetical protein